MASYSANQLTEAALQLLGVLDAGGTPSTAQQDAGLAYLQALVDNANDDPTMALSTTATTQALSGAQSYTVTRYSKVLAAKVTMTNGVEMPVRVLQDSGQFWALVDAASSSPLVQYCFYDRAATSPKIYVSPVAANGTLSYTVPTPITNWTDKTTAVAVPLGYEAWLKCELAHFLASTYAMPVPESVMTQLTKALTAIKTLNSELLGPSGAVPPVAQHVVTA